MRKIAEFQKYLDLVLSKLPAESEEYLLFYSVIPVIEKEFLQNTGKHLKTELLKLLAAQLFGKNGFTLSDKINIPKEGVLILPAELNHLDQTLPVYEVLKKKNTKVSYIVERNDLFEKLVARGIVPLKMNLTYTKTISLSGVKKLIRMLKILSLSFRAARQVGEPSFFSKTIKALAFAETVASVKLATLEILRRYNPKYLLLGYDHSLICRPVNILCYAQHINTGCIQHGVLNYLISPFSLADHYYVWDKTDQKLIDSKQKVTRAIVTGPLGIEKTNPSPGEEFNAVDETFRTAKQNHKAIALVAFSGPGHNVSPAGHAENIKMLHAVIQEMPGVFFIFKLHPKDELHWYDSLNGLPNVRIFKMFDMHVNDIELYLKNTDFVITGASTVSFESWRQHIPVISLDGLKDLEHIEFIHDEICYKASNKIELFKACSSIINKDETYHFKTDLIRDYSERFIQYEKANPAEIIAGHINEIIKQ